MTKSQLQQLIREEIQSLVPQNEPSSIKNIRKDLADRDLDLVQLDTVDELYKYIQMMINLLPSEVKDGENFKTAFRKIYADIMVPKKDEKE